VVAANHLINVLDVALGSDATEPAAKPEKEQ
jgi:hypothetical protein